MKIKMVLIDNDALYTLRAVEVFNECYGADVEIYTFASYDMAASSLDNKNIDVLIVSEDTFDEQKHKSLTLKTKSTIIFVNSKGIGSLFDFPAVCKYQRVDILHKNILSILSENTSLKMENIFSEKSTKLISFLSVCGGTGNTSCAVALSYSLAQRGKRVIYVDMNLYSDTDSYFNDDGDFGLSDVVYTILGQKKNAAVKIKTYVKKDVSGVNFFSPCKNALDWSEMRAEDKITLTDYLSQDSDYDYVIIDYRADWGEYMKKLLSESVYIFTVSDSSRNCVTKLEQFTASLSTYSEISDNSIFSRYNVICNKSVQLPAKNSEVKYFGNIRFVAGKSKLRDIAGEMSAEALFRQICQGGKLNG